MNVNFTPCKSKSACRDDGSRCLACGRSLEEIVWLRDLIDQLARMAITYRYDNIDQFTAYIAQKLPKIVTHRLTLDAGDTPMPAGQEASNAN